MICKPGYYGDSCRDQEPPDSHCERYKCSDEGYCKVMGLH